MSPPGQLPALLLVLGACARPPDSRAVTSAPAPAHSARSSSAAPSARAPSSPPAPAAVTQVVAGPTLPAPLFAVAEGADVYTPLAFDDRSLLRVRQHLFSLDGQKLTPLQKSPFFSGLDLDQVDIAGVTGKWPEHAWMLVKSKNPCLEPSPTRLGKWTGTHWRFGEWSGEDAGVLDVCRLGDRHFALGKGSRAHLQPLDDGAPAAPEFEAAPGEAAREGCRSKLDAERCFTLPRGDLVIYGTLCGERPSRPAVEHFVPGAKLGTTHPLPLPPGVRSVMVLSASAGREGVLFGGSREASSVAYLARFSALRGAELIPVPNELSPITTLVESDDGKLWVSAPPFDESASRESPDASLWQRTQAGGWHRLSLPRTLEDGKRNWQLAPPIWLFSVNHDAWVDAIYFDGDPTRKGTLKRRILYRERAPAEITKLGPPTRALVPAAAQPRCSP